MSTATALRRLRSWLLVCALILLVATSLATVKTRSSVDVVAGGTAPSVVELLAAREALAAADAAVISGFGNGPARFAGTGSEYQSQLAAASQALARAAEYNLAGEGASRTIQRLQSLLVEYLGLVGEAESRYQEAGFRYEQLDGDRLWLTYLWNASRLMQAPDTGILAELDSLLRQNQRLLDRQIGPPWLTWASTAFWLVAVLAVLALLIVTIGFVSVRFRRTLNLSLTAAGLVVLAGGAAAAFSLVADWELRAAREDLAAAVADSQAQVASSQAQRDQDLAALVRARCGAYEQSTECQAVVDSYLAGPADPDGETNPAGGAEELTAAPVVARTDAARNAATVGFLAPLAALVVPLLVVFGLQPRFDEYRYRVR